MESLKAIRESLNLTAAQVVARGVEKDPTFPPKVHALYKIERYGTDRYTVITILADIYGKPVEEIARLAKAQQQAAGNNFLAHSA